MKKLFTKFLRKRRDEIDMLPAEQREHLRRAGLTVDDGMIKCATCKLNCGQCGYERVLGNIPETYFRDLAKKTPQKGEAAFH